MERGWRRAILGVFGLGTVAAVLLASGFLRPAPQAAPEDAAVLPPAVALPQIEGARGAAAAAAAGSQTPDARIAALTQELQDDPTRSAAWAELGELYGRLRRFPQAADAFATALELEPGNGEYRSAYATALFMLGMTRAAVREYRAVVEQEPQNPGAHMNLAIALSHSTPPNIPAATVEWEEVLRLAPGQPIAAQAEQYLAGYRKP
ncbi:MAG: tetratricopeptide repeat protein [Chloroflexi bacterium]|nr:tetratricopeptide repeat protein [Chloroflexota bacterium]